MTIFRKSKKPLVYAVVGPTASGKSEYAVTLAKKINGEILSVDSRQIYRGMDIGTGKVNLTKRQTYKNIPHYGIDIASPKRQYSVAQFQAYSNKVIADILRRGKTPILCGGTMHWMDAVVYNQQLPQVKPDAKLRRQLEKKSIAELFVMLRKLDPKRANSIDNKNPRRLIRALEIVMSTGKPVPHQQQTSPYDVRWIGLKPADETLHKKIAVRLKQRIKEGMIDEVKHLHQNGISWKRLESFGLEYKYCALFLQGKLNKEQLFDELLSAIKKYSKRQMTWWKRNPNIVWMTKSRRTGKIL